MDSIILFFFGIYSSLTVHLIEALNIFMHQHAELCKKGICTINIFTILRNVPFLFKSIAHFTSVHTDCQITFYLLCLYYLMGMLFLVLYTYSSFPYLCDIFIEMKLPAWLPGQKEVNLRENGSKQAALILTTISHFIRTQHTISLVKV